MDLLGVKMRATKKQSRRSRKGIKVVYISSPMKVETCASKFRALVQELTGKDSDAALRFIGIQHDHEHHVPVVDIHDDHHRHRGVVEEEQELAVPNFSTSTNSNCSYESSSPAGSDSIFESFDKYLAPMDGSFMSMFQPNVVYDSSDQLHL